MNTIEQAKSLANSHIAQLSPIHRDYFYAVDPNPARVEDGWYFNYIVQCKNDIPISEQIEFGGPPGYVITDKGNVAEISWEEYHSLHNSHDD